jgi:hypothetical protein
VLSSNDVGKRVSDVDWRKEFEEQSKIGCDCGKQVGLKLDDNE